MKCADCIDWNLLYIHSNVRDLRDMSHLLLSNRSWVICFAALKIPKRL